MREVLLFEKRRFADFLASPEGIATNVLADRFERLERCGRLERRQYLERPPREEYHPTARGVDLTEGFVYEKRAGDGGHNVVTTTVWKDEQAFENARRAVAARLHVLGIDAAEKMKALGVQIERGVFTRSAY